MLLPSSGSPIIKCHEEFLSFLSMFLPKRLDSFPPRLEMLRMLRCVQRFPFKLERFRPAELAEIWKVVSGSLLRLLMLGRRIQSYLRLLRD